MYLDLEDYRPDTPRVPAAISLREGVLISLLLHALAVIAYLVMPDFRSQVNAVLMPAPEREPTRFVQMIPRTEMKAVPKPDAEASDLDRRAASPLVAPDPRNAAPFSRGDTPEKVVGAPNEKPAGPDNPATGPPAVTIPDTLGRTAADAVPALAPPAGGGLAGSLRNLQKFLQEQNYENPQGGQTEPGTDIQFDAKGIDFGPWIARFVAQVKRNWYVPQAAMFLRGRVVIQFYVLRNGTITEIKVVQPSTVEPFTLAAFNALKLSNPTLALPPGYPDDRVLFTVTFHYNDKDPR
jgi:TonB family protein